MEKVHQSTDLPAFSKIAVDSIQSAIEVKIKENRRAIASLAKTSQPNWDNLVKPLSLLNDSLDKAWSPVRHLNSVKSSDELRQAYNNCLPLISEYATDISQNRQLFDAYNTISKSEAFAGFTQAQQKTIADSLVHFRLGGVELKGEHRQDFQQLQKDLSNVQSRFENNLLDATQAWQYLIEDEADLVGLPDYAKAMLRQLAEQKDLGGYRITLDMPCYLSVMTYAENRSLRKKVYDAFVTRASDQSSTNDKFDNADNMVEIVAKRQEKAKLLGFSSYAEYSLETKMAKSVEEVKSFLLDLADRSRVAALQEVDERQKFAQSLGFDDTLEACDYLFFGEKLKQHQYGISDEELKPYFSDKAVISGLFEIASRLFKIQIKKIGADGKIDVWDDDVTLYEISNQIDDVIGYFYLDLYARENKRGGAWMDECVNRYHIDGHTQLPVAYLTCNLTPPIGDAAALFTHDEVITLFHEFGHGLHHMLTRVDVPEVAGINGVEWDAVELPSQFMENFCWDRQALHLFARHYQTGELLPEALLERMLAARNFQSAIQMLRQIEFSLFDIRLHELTNVASVEQIQSILDQIRAEVAVVATPSNNRFQNGFSHIFAGGYAAGYYSYKWAEVLSADAFAAFEDEGVFNPQTGQRFLQCILERGGSRPAIESFRCFRGRDPEIDALLRHSGIVNQ